MDSRLTEMNWSISSFVASFLFSLYKKNLYTEVVGHLPLTSSESTSLAVQWLRLCASTAGGAGSIPGQETRIPHALGLGQKKPPKICIKWIIIHDIDSVTHPPTPPARRQPFVIALWASACPGGDSCPMSILSPGL